MIFKNNFLLLSIFVFSALSSTQEVDQDLLSQLSLDEIEAAREILESQKLIAPEIQDMPDVEESLVDIKEDDGESDSNKFGYDFRCEQSYQLLKDVVREADEEEDLKQFVELQELNKRDSEIYRNYLAEKGIEKTPAEVREHFATIEYGLEFVFKNKGMSEKD